MDGLDLALCSFEQENGRYSFEIHKTKTIDYNHYWKDALKNAAWLKTENYFSLNHEYGEFIAKNINEFLADCTIKPSVIASHGHTVYHQPKKHFSVQIGSGASIAAITGIKTICDFRSTDVALGGQGAPLVPIGDKLLFPDYQACLNIGGIANISFDNSSGERTAFDICFANMVLNFLTEEIGKPYDDGGNIAASGTVNEVMAKEINRICMLQNRVSLSRELFEESFMPLILKSSLSIPDKLATFTEALGAFIGWSLQVNMIKSVVVTGGGAYNKHFITCIKKQFKGEVIIPSDEIIQFKEALIFAFLGYLRLTEKTNTLKSVTRASRDSIGGAVYLP